MIVAQRLARLPRPLLGYCVMWWVLVGALLVMSLESRADASLTNRLKAFESRQIVVYSDPPLALQQAVLMAKKGDGEAASRLLQQITARWPDLDIGFHEALILFELGQFGGARDQFSKVLEADPSSFWSLYYRAQSAAALGQLNRAMADYRRLLSLRPDLSPGYYLTMTDWLVAGDKEGIAEAISLLDRRMEEVGALSVLLQRSIDLEVARGNISAAIDRTALFDARIKATPEWKARVAALLLQQGRSRDAAAYLQLAREQIANMKPTPARRETLRQIVVLDTLVSTSSSAPKEEVMPPLVVANAQQYPYVTRP